MGALEEFLAGVPDEPDRVPQREQLRPLAEQSARSRKAAETRARNRTREYTDADIDELSALD